jgi:CTD small phosphatase-like protein 2
VAWREGLNESFSLQNSTFWYNVRPYTYEFLQRMSQIYEVFLFTMADGHYANYFFNVLNERTGNCITGVFSREHCIQLYKAVFLKDLEIVANRNLKDMVLLDNTTISFGFHLNNGVPILTYDNDPEDM